MLTIWSSWKQPLLGLLLFLLLLSSFKYTEISAYSLPDDWSIDDIQNSQDMPAVQPDNVPIINPATPTTTTAATTTDTDTSSEFALQSPAYSGVGDVLMSSDISSIAQGSNTDCHPSSDNTKRQLSRGLRAREEDKICPAPFNNGDEKGGQPLPPNTGQQGKTGQDSGGSGETIRRVVLPTTGSKVQYLFFPEGSRPKRNRQICPELLYAVPICGKSINTYTAVLSPFQTTLMVDPCYPCTLQFFLSFSATVSEMEG